MSGRVLTVAAVLVAALSGCTAFEESTPGRPATTSPLPATDGTDLAACRDAACEVEVREDDVWWLHLHDGGLVRLADLAATVTGTLPKLP